MQLRLWVLAVPPSQLLTLQVQRRLVGPLLGPRACRATPLFLRAAWPSFQSILLSLR